MKIKIRAYMNVPEEECCADCSFCVRQDIGDGMTHVYRSKCGLFDAWLNKADDAKNIKPCAECLDRRRGL